MTPDEALSIVDTKAAGRTWFAGMGPYADEVLAAEVRRLRAVVYVNAILWGKAKNEIDAVLYPTAQRKTPSPGAGHEALSTG